MIPTIWDDVRHTNGVDYHLNWQKQSPEALVKWVQVAGLLVQVGGLLGWWSTTTVDGRNPANQSRFVVSPILYEVFAPSQVVVWDF